MKKVFYTLLLCFGFFMGHSQLIISEIMYNPPESGTDSLEYIELYNTSGAEIDLAGYVIADNNLDTISSGTIGANDYVVVAMNKNAFMSVFSVDDSKVIGATNIALKNGGETVYIMNPQLNVLDSVKYDSDAPWPTFDQGTNGGGASIELCDATKDNNLASSWSAADNDLGIMVNGRAVKGTPAAANTVACTNSADHVILVSSNVFTPSTLTIQSGETVRWENTGGFHNVNGTQDTYPENPEGFTNGDPSSSDWVYEFTFTTVGTYNYQCDPHVSFGMVGQIIVESGVTELPFTDISEARKVDADGVAIYLGDTVRVMGVIHGENLNPNGQQFALIDVAAGEGIGVYADTPLGYNYAEADMIDITGVVSQYNGLTQVNPITITYVSSGNDLMTPVSVTELNESTESQFVRINNVSFVDPSDWKGDGSSFNITVVDGDGIEYALRVDRDSQFADQSAPDGSDFNVEGIGGQYDNSEPYLDGYQLFPTSFSPAGAAEDYKLEGKITVGPNPASDIVYINTDLDLDRVQIVDRVGRIISDMDYRSTIDVSALDAGIYIITFYQNDKYQSQKLMVK